MPSGYGAAGAGILTGLSFLREALQTAKENAFRQQQLDLQRATAEREAKESAARLETEAIQRQLLQAKANRLPADDAYEDFTRMKDVKGIEGALNDPAAVALADKAGIKFERRPLPPPALVGMDTQYGPVSGEDARRAMIEDQGLFPATGVVKPPDILEKETERELAIRRANTVQDILARMGRPTAGGALPFDDSPMGRLQLKLALGINGNDVYGSVRETPTQAAARSAAEAAARFPFQAQLIDRAAKQRGLNVGDPYFSTALNSALSLIPITPNTTPEQIDQIVNIATQLATKAQAASPKGNPKPPAQPPAAPPTAAPSVDGLIDQAVKRFGTYQDAMKASQDPRVQSNLKASGIDPAAYLRRMQARALAERLAGGGQH